MDTAIKNIANGYGDLWGTPPNLWAEIKDRYFNGSERKVFDPCPGVQSLPETRTHSGDGLAVDWWHYEDVFVNPPFSDIQPWVEKALVTALEPTLVVMLVPVRADQTWWHIAAPNAKIIFIKGRVQYFNHKLGTKGKSPAFPSCLLIFGTQDKTPAFWWPVCHRLRMKRNNERILACQANKKL